MGDALTPSLEGFHMIKTLEIKNFRCYDHIKISNLKRINIIVGSNASGKTTLLEAMFLALGAAPDLQFHLRKWRGLTEQFRVSTDLASHHEPWTDLFPKFDEDKPPLISLKGSDTLTRTLKIFYAPIEEVVIPLGGALGTQRTAPITFQWKKGSKVIGTSKAAIVGGELRITGAGIPTSAQFFAGSVSVGAFNSADQFSELRKSKKERSVVKAMVDMFDFINDIQVLTGQPGGMIFADLPSMPRLMPLGLVSAGINKFMAVLCAMATHEKGVVLLDEVENGFYYETMPKIWAELFRFSKANGVQIFASTHSLEALRSLLPAIKGHESEICLLKATREKDRSTVRLVEGKYFEAALEGNVEVR